MIACLAVHVPSPCSCRFFGLFYLLWRLGHLLSSIVIVYLPSQLTVCMSNVMILHLLIHVLPISIGYRNRLELTQPPGKLFNMVTKITIDSHLFA